jgi:N-acetylmuramoyl-L-alanine amidase CwlA
MTVLSHVQLQALDRLINNEPHYLGEMVRWKDWPSEYDQWVHTDDMGNAKEAIQKYKKHKAKLSISIKATTPSGPSTASRRNRSAGITPSLLDSLHDKWEAVVNILQARQTVHQISLIAEVAR